MSAFPHIADEEGDVWGAFDILSQPAFVFIDDDGTVVDRTGSLGADGLAERLDDLVSR